MLLSDTCHGQLLGERVVSEVSGQSRWAAPLLGQSGRGWGSVAVMAEQGTPAPARARRRCLRGCRGPGAGAESIAGKEPWPWWTQDCSRTSTLLLQ